MSILSRAKVSFIFILSILMAFSPLSPLRTFLPIIPRATGAVAISDPTQWGPFGPNVPFLLIRIYSDPPSEVAAFRAGLLDGMDSPLSSSDLATLQLNPDVSLTGPVSEARMFQIEFNHLTGLFGVPFMQTRSNFTAIHDGKFDGTFLYDVRGPVKHV